MLLTDKVIMEMRICTKIDLWLLKEKMAKWRKEKKKANSVHVTHDFDEYKGHHLFT